MQLGPVTILSRKKICNTRGELYLDRFKLIECPLFSVYLHHILRSDDDRHLHDHPWWFFTMILWGGYIEQEGNMWGRILRAIPRLAPSCYYSRAKRCHRVDLVRPTWTLVVTGRRKREWGFLTESGWVDNQKYLGGRDKC